ncbi:aminotransferase class V-fold PLP-dependent enzyme [Alteribacter populi]|uniref:aminotransferase class V-fold PLP-dependent enzyme n=1 Tax=Alteribacter populi TaxID=2011011 RepID=UPI000BBB1C5B|nr:aminotransferase class V-fold PLP-dependent enzyme [Alteribacter populi]
MIYLDQAASSFPKPKTVAVAMAEAVNEYGANPGRSGHRLGRKASETIDRAREKLSSFFQCPGADRVLFYQNATQAINQGLLGFSFESGDHVIATKYEHNSVRRPLEWLKKEKGIEVTYLTPDSEGRIETKTLLDALRATTKMVVATHASNVTGTVLPVEEWGEVLHNETSATFMVDASQTAGVLPIDMKKSGIDLLAFPGHKGLLGPQGVGVLMVKPDVKLSPIYFGGTGSHSETPLQPDVWPTGMQSGTLNTPGIAGLVKGLEAVEKMGLDNIYEHETHLTDKLIAGLSTHEEIHVVQAAAKRLGVVSFYMDGADVHEIAMILDEHYNIAVRAGLHCAPLSHYYFNTAKTGLVRVSVGPYNTENEIDTFIEAITEIKEGLLG